MNGLKGRLRLYAAAGIAVTLCVTGGTSALADAAPPFEELLRMAENAPRNVESSARIRQAEGLAEQAGARPNPTVGLTTENVLGSSPYSGLDRSETTLQWSQPIELGGKRGARIEAGQAGIVAAQAQDRDARIGYAYDLAMAYAAAEIAGNRVDLVIDEMQEGQEDLRVAKALVAAGAESRLRQLQAETSLNAVMADLDAARANQTAAFARLAAITGQPEPYSDLSQSILDIIPVKDASLVGPVDPKSTSSYVAAAAQRDAAQYRVKSERKNASPDINVNLGVRRLQYEGSTALMGGVSVPLPLFDRNKGNISASMAEADIAQAKLDQAMLNAQAESSATLAILRAAEARVASGVQALETAEEAYRLARIAYEAGKTPLSEMLAARHGLGQARTILLDARAAQFEAHARLARLEGSTITGEIIQ